MTNFKKKLNDCIQNLKQLPPTRETFQNTAQDLTAWRTAHHHPGLWPSPPLMLTATIDDAWGHGLEIIEKLAAATGVQVQRLGLLLSADRIIAACRERSPDFLGLTVLQFDSDDMVAEVVRNIPASTLLIAGGAAYQFDDDFAERTGTSVVINNGAAFLRFLMQWKP